MSEIQNAYVIGMDCGTTNIKAVLLSDEGVILEEESRESTTYHISANAAEQDALEWWENAVSILKAITNRVGPRISKNIKGIAVSSHTVSMLPLDEHGRPLRNALTCQDRRSGNELHRILKDIGRKRFVEMVGGQPDASFLPNKILWFKEHEPDLYAKTKFFVQASSYINMKLTGVLVSDLDQAIRTQCMDINTMSWSEEIGELIGTELDKVMPPLADIDEIIGIVTKEAAERTGLPEGAFVSAGCSDAYASIYALGLSEMGDAGESAGTTSLVFAGATEKSRIDVPVITRPCTIDKIPWIFDAPITSTGAALKWFIDVLGAEEKEAAERAGINIYAYLNEIALEAQPGSRGLFFYPYLLGERAPLWNDYARGMFIGMNMDVKRCELVRSVFEGTAYALRHVVETIRKSGAQVSSLRVCGGGANSDTWNMIKASMLHVPVVVIDEASGSVPTGDALIIGHKIGVFPDLTEAVEQSVRIRKVIYPVQEWVNVYDRLFPIFLKMYENLDDSLLELHKTTESLQTASLL